MAKDPAGTDSSEKSTKATPENIIIDAAKAEAAKIIEAAKKEAQAIVEAAKGELETQDETGLTIAEAAALVHRTIVVPAEKEGGKPTTKTVAIDEAEVLSFKDCGDHVIVVTQDGQKFTGEK